MTANDREVNGVWMHASTGAEVTFFGPKAFQCFLSANNYGPLGGDAVVIYISDDNVSGCQWCDWYIDYKAGYICKGKI